ncbi:helix-turn-helix transcriptional regulator [Nitrospira sp. CMX1]
MQSITSFHQDSSRTLCRDTSVNDHDQLLTLKQAAALTGFKTSTWRQWVYLKKVASVKFGAKAVRVFKRDVTQMIAAGTRPARHELTK